jgi:hypothetical protein
MKANVVATAGKKRKDESSRTDGVSSLRCASTDKSKPEIEAGNIQIAQMTMKEEVEAQKKSARERAIKAKGGNKMPNSEPDGMDSKVNLQASKSNTGKSGAGGK